MKKHSVSKKLDRRAWLFIIPSLVLIVSFVFYPMVQAFLTSFQTGIANNTEFGGLANYKRMLTDTTFQKALFNTVLFLIEENLIMIHNTGTFPYAQQEIKCRGKTLDTSAVCNFSGCVFYYFQESFCK